MMIGGAVVADEGAAVAGGKGKVHTCHSRGTKLRMLLRTDYASDLPGSSPFLSASMSLLTNCDRSDRQGVLRSDDKSVITP